jgi:hypothetical protein
MSWLKKFVALFWSAPETQSAVVSTKQPAQPLHPSSLVKAKRKYARKAASSTKAVVSRKPVQKAALAKRGQTGKSAAIPVSKTHPPASPAQTPKRKAAVLTSAGKKTTQSKTAAQTRTVRQSKARGS